MTKRKPNHVKRFRKEQKISVRKLAELCEMSHSSITNIENYISIPSQESILRISRALSKETWEVFMLNSKKVDLYFGRNTDQN